VKFLFHYIRVILNGKRIGTICNPALISEFSKARYETFIIFHLLKIFEHFSSFTIFLLLFNELYVTDVTLYCLFLDLGLILVCRGL
jgi:hypothetical protein